ncbi:MAG: hypothetical protein R2880_19745 [Deinococcales bacterium]
MMLKMTTKLRRVFGSKLGYLSFLYLLVFSILPNLGGCSAICRYYPEGLYYNYEPVYLSWDKLRDVESLAARAIQEAGKIYLHHNYLLINEPQKGIHILDNSEPQNPQKLSFIAIPGNVDLLVRDEVLYADNYVDLIALDISNPSNVTLIKRIENVFSETYAGRTDPEKGIIIDYEEGDPISYPSAYFCGQVVYDASNPPPARPTVSQAGSLTRFAAMQEVLYTIDGSALQNFNIADPRDPKVLNRLPVGFGIETLFPYEDKLFIGAMQGMHIYDASTPSNPQALGSINHIQSCDPVVVQGNLAYVTLRGSCFNQANRLEIIDISEPSTAKVVNNYLLQEPYGLGIDGDYLFVCDGDAGLKVFDHATEPDNLSMIRQFDEVKARDIIPFENQAIVIAENGLFQYDYSALPGGNLQLLSQILIPESP